MPLGWTCAWQASTRGPDHFASDARADANLFKDAFTQAQETNKTLLGSASAAPEVAASDAPVAADATTTTQTGEPVEKGKEAAPSADAEAATEEPPAYKDEGVAPPPEKTEVVQGEEVKEPTTEVRPCLPCSRARPVSAPC